MSRRANKINLPWYVNLLITNVIIGLLYLLFFSISILNTNCTSPSSVDTLYISSVDTLHVETRDTVFNIDTVVKKDSTFVYDTVFSNDTVSSFDTLIFTDSLVIKDSSFFFDTVFNFDTLVEITKDTVYNYDTIYDIIVFKDTIFYKTDIYVKRGILYAEDKVEDEEYWDIPYFTLSDTTIVNCWIRKGSGYMWIPPTWFFSDLYIRIFDDSKTDPGDEYIITAITP